MHETLSVKDISEHVFLSTSYVCTFFKSETGQTLNQYLTEYRMEKAKDALLHTRKKVIPGSRSLISLPGSATVTATISAKVSRNTADFHLLNTGSGIHNEIFTKTPAGLW